MSGGKFQKLSSGNAGGRTMWQIVWDGDEDAELDDDVTVVDASNMEYNSEDAEHVIYNALDAGDTSLKEELDAVITKSTETEEDPTAEKPKKNGYTRVHQPGATFDIESAQMEPENFAGEFNGNFLMPKDSDTDLILKISKGSEIKAKLKYAWTNFRNPLFWRTYWWLPLTIVGVVLIYTVVVISIVFTLGDN